MSKNKPLTIGIILCQPVLVMLPCNRIGGNIDPSELEKQKGTVGTRHHRNSMTSPISSGMSLPFVNTLASSVALSPLRVMMICRGSFGPTKFAVEMACARVSPVTQGTCGCCTAPTMVTPGDSADVLAAVCDCCCIKMAFCPAKKAFFSRSFALDSLTQPEVKIPRDNTAPGIQM